MKTTIDIAPDLMGRCKKLAHEQETTFRSLVEEGLERVLRDRSVGKNFKLRSVPFNGGGFNPGFENV